MIESALLDSGLRAIAGVDEAGRGACAGPLVVAAVILKNPLDITLREIADSKTLKAKKREELYDLICESALAFSIIEIRVEEIDQGGVHRANLEGMRRAVAALTHTPDYVLTDGYEISGLTIPALAIWKGDAVAISISAASILAKVYRDRVMVGLSQEIPGYGFEKHKGYITQMHSQSLTKLGVSLAHRKSFANVNALINNR